MLVKGASREVPTREVEVDCRASQLGGARLHGGNERASYTTAALILRNPQVTHPQALLMCMCFKSSAKRRKANNTVCALSNKTFEPPVRTEGAI